MASGVAAFLGQGVGFRCLLVLLAFQAGLWVVSVLFRGLWLCVLLSVWKLGGTRPGRGYIDNLFGCTVS